MYHGANECIKQISAHPLVVLDRHSGDGRSMSSPAATRVLAAIERNRKRVWALCYRMTGNRTDADDLAQEAVARAIERADQVAGADATGWLFRVTTRLCLDHLRRRNLEARVTALVDPLDMPELPAGEARVDAEEMVLLREDVRFAVVVALQRLSPRQRSVLVLNDVCDRPIDEIAHSLGTTVNAAKALLHRARASLARARRRSDVDVPVDREVVEQFARAVETGSVEAIAQLFADDIWGVVDGGGVVQAASKPTVGRPTIARQWQNAKRRLGQEVIAEVRRINGEPAVIIRLAIAPAVVVAIVHFETSGGRIVALRVNRDPARTAHLTPLAQ
jgi:RNA polymerase sigma-70 factor, ECF subfamily